MPKENEANIQIKKMRVADIEFVLEILREANLESWSSRDFQIEIERKDSFLVVAEINTKIVGFCVARLIRLDDTSNNSLVLGKNIAGNESEVYNIAVRELFRNCGVGQSLLDGLFEWNRANEAESIWLEVRNSNKSAIGFYKKNGFEEVNRRKNFYLNPNEDAIVMKKSLLPGQLI